MNFYEALRFCFEEDLPIKRVGKETIYGFVTDYQRLYKFVDELGNIPEITSDMLKAEWEEADVRE